MSYSYNNNNNKQRRRQKFQDLAVEHAKTRGALIMFVRQPLLSRLKWLLFGIRPSSDTSQS